MRSDPRKLVARLTPRARRHLEAAVTAAALGSHAELTPEHVLREVLADEGADAACVLDPDARATALADVERWLARLPRGAGRPALGDALVRWLERAWLVASLELGDRSTRSYALLVGYLELATRSAAGAPVTAALSLDQVRRGADALGRSAESAEPTPGASGAPGADAPAEGSALARFTTSFTERARRGELDPVLGRERETRQVADILCRRRKNNPVLVGEPGVGKTAVVEGLALAIARGEVPDALRDVDVRALELGLLEAGARGRGELELRLTDLIREVKTAPRPIVLFVDEAHTLVGAQPSGGTDAANLLKPALARGELRTIAATTFREHKKYFEKDAALERRFQKVTVEEPDEARAVTMLRGLVPTYERAHGVLVRDEAVLAAVRLGKRFLAGRQLPDSCVDVLDTTAARVRTSQAAPPVPIVERESEIAGMERELAALARERVERPEAAARVATLEKRIAHERGALAELEARWKAQREALERFLGARRALAETPLAEASRREREIDVRVAREAYEACVGDQAWALAEVDARAIAATVEAFTGIPVGDVERRQNELLRALEEHLDRRVVGQAGATRRVAEGLRIAQAGLRRAEAPRGVFLLVGPSGVGKTETAHAIAELLHGGDRFLTTINLSEYQEKHTVSRLVGSPPGYVGYGEGGKLTEAVRLRPHSVVLLDECEKADREVMNVFYQLLDRGVLADGEGRLVDFRSATLVLTSNLAAERIAALVAEGTRDLDAIERAVRPMLAAHFAPALLARMTVVPYLPLDEDALARIVDLELARVVERARAAHGLSLQFSGDVRTMLLESARDPSAGVRHLRARIETELLAPLASELLAPPSDTAIARALSVSLDAARRPSFAWSGR